MTGTTLKIVIAGVPKAGKTTIADKLGAELNVSVLHTDAFMGMLWSEASLVASYLFDGDGPLLMEGVMAVRAVRKWMRNCPDEKPCDILYWLDDPHPEAEELTGGQVAMAKGCLTIFEEIMPELQEVGVDIYIGLGDLECLENDLMASRTFKGELL